MIARECYKDFKNRTEAKRLKGKKIIAAGHICLDITPAFTSCGAELEPGKLIRVGKANISTGGSAANTGLGIKKLGGEVRIIGKIGSDEFGDMVREIVANNGVEDELLIDPEGSTSYSVVIAVPGIDRIFLHNPGANDTFQDADIPDSVFSDAAIFHFGYPSLMRKMYLDDGLELSRLLSRAKRHSTAVSLDFAAIDPSSEAGEVDWERVLANALAHVDFFVPSYEELCFMLDRERYEAETRLGGDITEQLDFERNVKPLARKCLSLGCRSVLIKCGMSGMYFQSAGKERMSTLCRLLGLRAEEWSDREIVQPIFPAEIVRSASGAGDTSISAFLLSILEGLPPEMCTALAAAEGACCVTEYDALSGLKPLDELKDMIKGKQNLT